MMHRCCLSLRVCLAVGLAFAVGACSRSTPAPVEHKGLSGSQAASSRPSAARSTVADVIVRKGDTVWGISRRTGVPVRALISANNLKPPFTLRPGQGLQVPSARKHVVRKGDTIYGISRRYGVDMSGLVRLNDLSRPYTIKPGQTLRLPALARLIVPRQEQSARPSAPRRSTDRAVTTALPPRAGSSFAWPVRGRIVEGYGPQGAGRYNGGLNIAAQRGQPVRAADNGVVAYAGSQLRGLGNLLLIRHQGGWITAYAHNEALLVRRGEVVDRGQVIGRVGATGSVRSPQLHFEIRKGTRTVDPIRYLPRLTSLFIQPDFQTAREILDELPGDPA